MVMLLWERSLHGERQLLSKINSYSMKNIDAHLQFLRNNRSSESIPKNISDVTPTQISVDV